MSNDLRELVQIFLDAKEERFREGHSSSYDDNEAGIRAVRDAVLAALTEAGALMPTLPDGWAVVSVELEPDGYSANLVYGSGDELESIQDFMGDGPTIPAAIANALEGAAK